MKIIQSKISDKHFEILIKLKKEYGFKSVYEVVQTILHGFLNNLQQAQEQTNDCDEIIEMFNENVFNDLDGLEIRGSRFLRP